MHHRARGVATALSAAILAASFTPAVVAPGNDVHAQGIDAASPEPTNGTVAMAATPTPAPLTVGNAPAAANGNPNRPHASPSPTPPAPTPTPASTATPTPTPTPTATATPGTTYTFDEEFSGTSLSSKWLHHMHCCGAMAGYDPTLSTVANGVLAMQVDRRSNGWYGENIDTRTTFSQKYGYFEARIKVPKGPGLWPAFWTYGAPNGSAAEIDTMEICANPLGTNGGNDAHELHNTVHWAGGATTTGRYYTVDLSLAYHVYAVDWRANAIRFYLDGVLTWTYSDTSRIPTVALPIVLNLGVGGQWCGPSNSTTPDGAAMLVDWVRVRP
jgi:beta-glucanase (GH16 family)